MFHGHVEMLAFVPPLTRGDRREVVFLEYTEHAAYPPTVTSFGSHKRFVKRRFSDIDAVSGHSDCLIWFKPL